jgi:hypothetical protein
MTLAVEVRKITPAMAAEMLAHNDRNRRLDKEKVAEYARDMSTGRWHLNGQTIQIAEDGTLLNGQHRLSAVVLADVSVDMLVVSGLPAYVRTTIDTGRKRTMSDVLGMDDVKNPSQVAAIAVRVMRWDAGDRKLNSTLRPTHVEQREWIEANPSVHRSAEVGRIAYTAFKPLRVSSTGAAHFIVNRISVSDAAEFFAQLSSGVGLKSDSGILALRNRLTNIMATSERVDDGVRLNMILRAWNAYRANESLYKIYATSSSTPIDPQ